MRSSVSSLALLSMSTVLLGGCAFAPSIPLLGAAFPDWLLCIVGGVAGTTVVHLALSRRGAICCCGSTRVRIRLR